MADVVSVILSLDTSTEYCSAALLSPNGLFALDEHARQSHSERILMMVEEVLARAQVRLSECDAIAFGAGPGSFTGLRIACAVAQGMALGAEIPVVPVGTLLAMAERTRLEHASESREPVKVLCVQDARMGEVYWAAFEWHDNDWACLTGPHLDSPAAIAMRWDGVVDWACGNAFSVYPDQILQFGGQVVGPDHPQARDIAAIGSRAWQRGEAIEARFAAPIYVREKVAMTTLERARPVSGRV